MWSAQMTQRTSLLFELSWQCSKHPVGQLRLTDEISDIDRQFWVDAIRSLNPNRAQCVLVRVSAEQPHNSVIISFGSLEDCDHTYVQNSFCDGGSLFLSFLLKDKCQLFFLIFLTKWNDALHGTQGRNCWTDYFLILMW